MSAQKGMVIALEGADGSGKSTQVVLLAEALRAKGHDVVTYIEPGSTEVGKAIRNVVLNQPGIDPLTELLLFSAARADLYKREISPAVEAGKIVITDRSLFSTYAYQVAANPEANLGAVFNVVVGATIGTSAFKEGPHVITLRSSVETLEARLNDAEKDVIESRDSEYTKRVREFYDFGMDQQPRNISVDGTGSIDETAADVLNAALKHIESFYNPEVAEEAPAETGVVESEVPKTTTIDKVASDLESQVDAIVLQTKVSLDKYPGDIEAFRSQYEGFTSDLKEEIFTDFENHKMALLQDTDAENVNAAYGQQLIDHLMRKFNHLNGSFIATQGFVNYRAELKKDTTADELVQDLNETIAESFKRFMSEHEQVLTEANLAEAVLAKYKEETEAKLAELLPTLNQKPFAMTKGESKNLIEKAAMELLVSMNAFILEKLNAN